MNNNIPGIGDIKTAVEELLKTVNQQKTAIEALLKKMGADNEESIGERHNKASTAMKELANKNKLLQGIVQVLQNVNLYFKDKSEGLEGQEKPPQELTFQDAITQLAVDALNTTPKNEDQLYMITPTKRKGDLEGAMNWLKANGYPQINENKINDVISKLTKQIDANDTERQRFESEFYDYALQFLSSLKAEKSNSNLSEPKQPSGNNQPKQPSGNTKGRNI